MSLGSLCTLVLVLSVTLSSSHRPGPLTSNSVELETTWSRWLLHTVNITFFILACYFLFTRYGQTNASGARLGLGMNSLFQVSLFCVYISTTTGHVFFQVNSGSTNYSVVAAMILIYFTKSVVTLAMHTRNHCSDFSSLIGAAGGRFGRAPACLCLAVPAILFASHDLLSFVSLANGVDPVTYRIMLQCRILLSALIWQLGFRRWCSSLQWFAMLTFVVASLTKTADTLDPHIEGSWATQGKHVGVVVCQVFISALGSVCLEVCQKELPVPTDLQNCSICMTGFLFLIPFTMRHGFLSLHAELLSSEAWGRLWGDPWMMGSILFMTAHGITMAYFLRELSVVLKEMSGTMVTVISALLEWTILQASPCTVVGVESVVVVVLALLVYNIDPVRARPALDIGGSEEQEVKNAEAVVMNASESDDSTAASADKRGKPAEEAL